MDVKILLHKDIDVDYRELTKCEEHCMKIREDFIKTGLRDEILEPKILTINPNEAVREKMTTTLINYLTFKLTYINIYA